MLSKAGGRCRVSGQSTQTNAFQHLMSTYYVPGTTSSVLRCKQKQTYACSPPGSRSVEGTMSPPPRYSQRPGTAGALPALAGCPLTPRGTCPCRTLRSPRRTPPRSLGARLSPARPATPCRLPCRAARRGCPAALPAAIRALQRAPPPRAGRTRRRPGPRARPAARAAPRAHCGLRAACT